MSKCKIFQKYREPDAGPVQSRKECVQQSIPAVADYITCVVWEKVEWIQALYLIRTEQPFFVSQAL